MTQMVVEYDHLKLRPEDERLRKDIGDLGNLVESLKLVGQIHDIIVDENWYVRIGTRKYLALRIAGIKQVKIDKRDGLSEDEWIIMEAHENLIRKDLDPVEEALSLVKAKESYERLYPKTKRHTIGGTTKGVRAQLKNTTDKLSDEKNLPISFTKDTAEKTGTSPRTVRRKIELGKAIQNGKIPNNNIQKLKQKLITPHKVMKELKRSESKSQRTKLCKDCAKADVRYCPYCDHKFIICRKLGNLPFRKIDAKACETPEEP
jgi:hypothetical protein